MNALQQNHSPRSIRIAMDGAVFLRRNDGSIVIRRTTTLIWIEIVLFGLLLIGVTGLVLAAVRRNDWNTFWEMIPWLVALIVVWLFLIILLRRPSIEIDRLSKVIIIGHSSSSRQIPFSHVAQITITVAVAPHFTDEEGIEKIDLGAVLDNDERIQIGSVSGGEARSAATTIATIIAEATQAAIAGLDNQKERHL